MGPKGQLWGALEGGLILPNWFRRFFCGKISSDLFYCNANNTEFCQIRGEMIEILAPRMKNAFELKFH